MSIFVKCPECGNDIRIRNAEFFDTIIQIDCPECNETVQIDTTDYIAEE